MGPEHDLLRRLCGLFDDELERQENVLLICTEQGKAARAHDVENLDARTGALASLIEDSLEAEQERVKLLREIVGALALPEGEQTLTKLIAAVPAPWRRRMSEFQESIRMVLAETQRVVRENANYMRRSSKVLSNSLAVLTEGEPVEGEGYDADGRDAMERGATPALINTFG